MRFSVSEAKELPPQHNSLTFPTTKRHTSPLLFSMSLPKIGRIELGLENNINTAIRQERAKIPCLKSKIFFVIRKYVRSNSNSTMDNRMAKHNENVTDIRTVYNIKTTARNRNAKNKCMGFSMDIFQISNIK